MQENLKIHRHTGRYDFKSWEIAEMKNAIPTRNMSEIAPRQKQINDMKEQIKTLQKHIDSLNDTTMQDSKKIEDGWENHTQDCYRLKNWHRRCYEFFAVESQMLLQTLPFEKYDNQTEAFESGDLRELNTDEEIAKYARILYHDGKTWSFGPRKPDQPQEDQPNDIQDAPLLALTDGDEVKDVEFEHFDPKAPDPVLFRNNLPIADIVAAHENTDPVENGIWETFCLHWELSQYEIDAVMQWHWERVAKTEKPDSGNNDAELIPNYPTLSIDEYGNIIVKRNGLKAIEVDQMSEKDPKIWDKYVKRHSLTEQEIIEVKSWCELPF